MKELGQPATPPAERAREQLDRLRRLHAATDQLLDAVAAHYGVSRIDMRCLEILERRGPCTAGELAKASSLSPAAITKVLRRLSDAGYAMVETPAQDRRQQVAHVSAKHSKQRQALWAPIQQSAATALGRLDESQHDVLASLLDELASTTESYARHLNATVAEPTEETGPPLRPDPVAAS